MSCPTPRFEILFLTLRLYRRFFGGSSSANPAPPKQTTLSFSSKSTNESKGKTPVKKEELQDEDTTNENRTPKSDEDAVNEQLASELKASPTPNGKGAFPQLGLAIMECRTLINSIQTPRNGLETRLWKIPRVKLQHPTNQKS